MPELTLLKAAETLETAYGWQKGKNIPCVDAALFAASYLRRIATGEHKQVVHARWKEVEPGSDILFECSHCGRVISTSWGSCEDEDTHGNNGCDPTEEWLCCPSCGALMDESDMRQTQDGKDDRHAEK